MDTILSTDGQMVRQTDGQTVNVKPVYPPFNFVEVGGIKIKHEATHGKWPIVRYFLKEYVIFYSNFF